MHLKILLVLQLIASKIGNGALQTVRLETNRTGWLFCCLIGMVEMSLLFSVFRMHSIPFSVHADHTMQKT